MRRTTTGGEGCYFAGAAPPSVGANGGKVAPAPLVEDDHHGIRQSPPKHDCHCDVDEEVKVVIAQGSVAAAMVAAEDIVQKSRRRKKGGRKAPDEENLDKILTEVGDRLPATKSAAAPVPAASSVAKNALGAAEDGGADEKGGEVAAESKGAVVDAKKPSRHVLGMNEAEAGQKREADERARNEENEERLQWEEEKERKAEEVKKKTKADNSMRKDDQLFGWKKCPNSPIKKALKQQTEDARRAIDTMIVTQFKPQDINTVLNNTMPTNPISGEDIPDLLLPLVQWAQKEMKEKLTFHDKVQGSSDTYIKVLAPHLTKQVPVKCPYQCHVENSLNNHKQVDLAGEGQKVAIKVNTPRWMECSENDQLDERHPSALPHKVNIIVRLLSGRSACICLAKTDHIEQLMSRIEEKEGIPKTHLLLLYRRTRLEPGYSLGDYSIENNSNINVTSRLLGGNESIDVFFANQEGLLEPVDIMFSCIDATWLTVEAKRTIHSIFQVLVELHRRDWCLGGNNIGDLCIYLNRAMMPSSNLQAFTTEGGKKDYDSFICFLEQKFSHLPNLPIELTHFLDALRKAPEDVRDVLYQKYLSHHLSLLSSTRRSDWIIDLGNICKEGTEMYKKELWGIIAPMDLSWLYTLIQKQPFRDMNDNGKLYYLDRQVLDVMLCMRDCLEHPQPKNPTGGYTCNRLKMEKILYFQFFKVLDNIMRMLILEKSDLSQYVAEYVTY